jgi:hypothetical protein
MAWDLRVEPSMKYRTESEGHSQSRFHPRYMAPTHLQERSGTRRFDFLKGGNGRCSKDFHHRARVLTKILPCQSLRTTSSQLGFEYGV